MKKTVLLFFTIFLAINNVTIVYTSENDEVIESGKEIQVNKIYESNKDFYVDDEHAAESSELPSGTLGSLIIDGKIQSQTEINNITAFLTIPGEPVSFSYCDINDYTASTTENNFCTILNSGVRKIGEIDLGERVKKGAIIVLWSYDGINWNNTPVYIGTDEFASYKKDKKNFYEVGNSSLSDGCFYKVYILYRTSQLVKEDNFLFIPLNEYETRWTVEEYVFFLMADDTESYEGEFEDDDTLNLFEPDSSLESDNSVAGVHYGNQSIINRLAGEEDFIHNNGNGHGYAAEAGNMQQAQIDGLLKGDSVDHKGQDRDASGHLIKNGADYQITQKNGEVITIQSKYYQNASGSIGACFDKDTKMFRYFDDLGNPMKIEVPADQYEKAVALMEEKIEHGLVPNVSDPKEAVNIVRKGSLTYKQAVNLAKAGTIESLRYDAINNCVSSGATFGISAAVQLALTMWETDGDWEASLKNAVYKGLEVGGNTFVAGVVISQLQRTGLNSILTPGSEAIVKVLGPKAAHVFSQVGRAGAQPIYGAAAMKHAAKLLRGNVVVGTVSMLIFTVPDIADMVQGKITLTQFVKNAATTASGIGGGFAGAAGGAAAGSIIPGPGTIVGGIIGGIAGSVGASMGADYVADLIAPDDAEVMLEIITEEFQQLSEEYLLNSNEAVTITNDLKNQIDGTFIKEMVASKDPHNYIREIMIPMIESLVQNRQKITLPSTEELAEELADTMEEIYDEIETDDSNE